MRVLTCAGFVDEVGPQTYASTPVTKALTIPKIYDGVKHLYVGSFPSQSPRDSSSYLC